jgi:hypothetical protein
MRPILSDFLLDNPGRDGNGWQDPRLATVNNVCEQSWTRRNFSPDTRLTGTAEDRLEMTAVLNLRNL